MFTLENPNVIPQANSKSIGPHGIWNCILGYDVGLVKVNILWCWIPTIQIMLIGDFDIKNYLVYNKIIAKNTIKENLKIQLS